MTTKAGAPQLRNDQAASAEIIATAAYWAAQLAESEGSEVDRQACEQWCREDPLHRDTFQRMHRFDRTFDELGESDHAALRTLLNKPASKSKRVGAIALACLTFAGSGWAATQTFAVRELFPDYTISHAAPRQIALSDGSSLNLDTDTRADFEVTRTQRTVTLFQGRILARVAHDRQHPFVVETQDGTATALGTAFMVEKATNGTRVIVVQSTVRACSSTGDCLNLAPTQSALLTQGKIIRLPDQNVQQASAWAEGWLEVNDRPVAEVLTDLNRYRDDPVEFNPTALAGIRISGSFPLADPDRALQGVSQAAGLRLGVSPSSQLSPAQK